MLGCRRGCRSQGTCLLGIVLLCLCVQHAGATSQSAADGPQSEGIETPDQAETLTRPLRPSTFLAPGTSPFQSTHLLGDWGGLLPRLEAAGIDPYVEYLSEAAGNPTGGKAQTGAYAQQVALSATLDWYRIAGVRGLSTHVTVVNREGNNLSGAMGNLFNVQEIYGGGGDVARLAYLAMEQVLAGGRVNVMAGRMEVGTDFAASDLYCSFQSLGLCPNPESMFLNGRANNGGFEIFPYSSWGGRIRVRPVPTLYFQAGVFEINPSLAGETGWNWSTSGSTGVQVPVEIGFTPGIGSKQLPGHYKLGAAFDSATHADVLTGMDGRNDVGLGDPGRRRRGQTQVYALADQMIHRSGDGDTGGLILLGGFVWSSRATSEIDRFGFAGLTWAGGIPGRKADQVSFLSFVGTINERLATTETIEQQNGRTLSAAAPGVQSNEVDFEANYAAALWKGLKLMPNVQYIVRPGASSHYRNALVLGLRTDIML